MITIMEWYHGIGPLLSTAEIIPTRNGGILIILN